MKMITLPSTLRVSILGSKRRVEQKLDYTREDKYTMLIFNASEVVDPEYAINKDRRKDKVSVDPENNEDRRDQKIGSKILVDSKNSKDQKNMISRDLNNSGNDINKKLQMNYLNEFEFQWFCRLSPSSRSDVVTNITMNPSQICSSKTNWTRLKSESATKPVMSLSAKHLMSKREYQFKVMVTKDGRLPGEAVQNVKITSSQLPKGIKIK